MTIPAVLTWTLLGKAPLLSIEVDLSRQRLHAPEYFSEYLSRVNRYLTPADSGENACRRTAVAKRRGAIFHAFAKLL